MRSAARCVGVRQGNRGGSAPQALKQANKPAAGADNGELDLGSLSGLLGYQIRQIQTALFRDFVAITERYDITPGQFSLLMLIQANPGVSQTRLTSTYKVDKSTLSLSISVLARRALVHRSRAPDGNRHYALSLSDSGRQLLRRVRERVDVQERRMAALLRPGERERLLDMLARIARGFERQAAAPVRRP